MLERTFQTKFYHWLQQNPPTQSAAYEFKVVKGSTFNLKQWIKKSSHQAHGLAKSKLSWIYHKISDQSMETKPFDAFVLSGSGSFLVVWFEAEKAFCILDIEEVMELHKEGKNVKFSEIPRNCIETFQ